MITTYCFLSNPAESPEDTQQSLSDTLEAQGVTDFSVTLMGVDVTGYRFTVEAEETDGNAATLRTLFGTMNTRVPSRITQERSLADAAQAWRIAGGDGRFARENPPPDWAV